MTDVPWRLQPSSDSLKSDRLIDAERIWKNLKATLFRFSLLDLPCHFSSCGPVDLTDTFTIFDLCCPHHFVWGSRQKPPCFELFLPQESFLPCAIFRPAFQVDSGAWFVRFFVQLALLFGSVFFGRATAALAELGLPVSHEAVDSTSVHDFPSKKGFLAYCLYSRNM